MTYQLMSRLKKCMNYDDSSDVKDDRNATREQSSWSSGNTDVTVKLVIG